MRRVGGVLVALLGCAMIVPFLYMIATAFMGEFEVLRYPPPLLPARLHPENFASARSEEHTSELQSRPHLVCRLLLEKKKKKQKHSLDRQREQSWKDVEDGHAPATTIARELGKWRSSCQ